MIKAILLIAAMCWLLPHSYAAYEDPSDAFRLTPEEAKPSGDDLLFRRKEKFNRDEKMVQELDDELGIRDNRRWTGEDRNRLSGAFHLNGQYEFYQELQTFELTWMRRVENWSKLWWGATYRRTTAGFGNVAQNRTGTGNPNGEGAFVRPKDAKQTINAAGLGVGYRLRLLTDLVDTENTFETVNVWGTYTTLAESFIGENYSGWGMSADYGLHRRVRSSFFWGGKFTYNIAWVERGKRGTESAQDRSLSLGWFSLALEAGFFF
jgi:hypothetical protein